MGKAKTTNKEESMAMTKLQITFEVRVYDGRIEPPYDEESNWDLWFYDNFIKSALNFEGLREGEYIKIVECREVPDDDSTS